jgi:hypothetical protein
MNVKAEDQLPSAVDALIEEYRVLYSLVALRLNSLDRRVPVAVASVGALLSGLAVLPRPSQLILLAAIPMGLIWFLRATVNHARSAEDVLRRIEELERRINELVGEEILGFQSRHPSRGRCVGGRTAAESVRSVFGACLVVIGACLFLAHETSGAERLWLAGYAGYAGAITGYLFWCMVGLRRYRYREQVYGLRPHKAEVLRQALASIRPPTSRGRPQPLGLWFRCSALCGGCSY